MCWAWVLGHRRRRRQSFSPPLGVILVSLPLGVFILYPSWCVHSLSARIPRCGPGRAVCRPAADRRGSRTLGPPASRAPSSTGLVARHFYGRLTAGRPAVTDPPDHRPRPAFCTFTASMEAGPCTRAGRPPRRGLCPPGQPVRASIHASIHAEAVLPTSLSFGYVRVSCWNAASPLDVLRVSRIVAPGRMSSVTAAGRQGGLGVRGPRGRPRRRGGR